MKKKSIILILLLVLGMMIIALYKTLSPLIAYEIQKKEAKEYVEKSYENMVQLINTNLEYLEKLCAYELEQKKEEKKNDYFSVDGIYQKERDLFFKVMNFEYGYINYSESYIVFSTNIDKGYYICLFYLENNKSNLRIYNYTKKEEVGEHFLLVAFSNSKTE